MDYPEDTLSGTSLGLNLLNRVAFARKQKAARVTWHTHEHIELIMALDGATVYEFADGQTVDFTGGHYMVISPGVAHRGLQDVRRPTSIVGLMLDPHSPRATGRTDPAFSRQNASSPAAWPAQFSSTAQGCSPAE